MSAQATGAYFGIGEVLAQLRGEFPDVSVSKIRFLESEGLIQPARSPSGYRRFGPGDVERLRFILTAQRDHYLPLRVIKDRLDAAAERSGPRGLAGEPARPPGRALLSRRELLDAAGIGDEYLAELEDFGLVRRSGRQYGPDALRAARMIAALGRYGVQARHLRVMRASAERETSLIEQVVAPMLQQRSAGSRERAGQVAREIAALSVRLHAALVGAALAEAGFADPDVTDLGFTEPGLADEGLTDGGFGEPGFGEPGRADGGRAGGRRAQARFGEPGVGRAGA
jgi:DNA-binding transcriptional MerR regulator